LLTKFDVSPLLDVIHFSHCKTPLALHSPLGLIMPAGMKATEEFFYTRSLQLKNMDNPKYVDGAL
jgi:hypothetical protein